jgi:hypothetical protein
MRSGSAAEAILALFTSPDRATSIVGDLKEQAPTQCRGWFWLQIVRTAAAFFWQELRGAPLRISVLVVAGWIAHEAATLYVAVPFAQFLGWTHSLDHRGPEKAAWLVGVLLFGFILVPFLVGLLMAHFSGGRPLTISIVFALVGQNLLAGYFIYGYWISMGELPAAEKISLLLSFQLKIHAFKNSVVAIAVLAAGALYRRRALQRVTAP